MDVNIKRYALSVFIVTAISLAGCGGSGSGSSQKTGSISIGVSDAPIHYATKVCVAFNEIEFKPADGKPFVVETMMAEPINMLDFQGMNAAPLLMGYEVPAGEYQWLRLGVNAVRGGTGGALDDQDLDGCQGDASYIATADEAYNMYVPSGSESGLKLHGAIVIPAGGAENFTADIDLMKSISSPGGLAPDVIFRPTIRLVNNLEVGGLTGMVDSGLVVESCAPSVYVFDDDTVPDSALDVNNAIASAIFENQSTNVDIPEYHYTVGFLAAEMAYEVAFSCDDGVTLSPASGVLTDEVIAGEVTTADIPNTP
jgi:hypothetical protein